jgi:Family of unknown function (DUF6152)
MRSRAAMVLTIGMALGFPCRAILAHHSFSSEFDNSIAVTLQGVVTSVEMINPHSFIYLDVKAHGAVERWALEGPALMQILRRGLDREFIKAGDELGVCGYLARGDVVPTRTEPVTARAARKLQAAVLTLPNRETLVWNNYRQGKCRLDKPFEVRIEPDAHAKHKCFTPKASASITLGPHQLPLSRWWQSTVYVEGDERATRDDGKNSDDTSGQGVRFHQGREGEGVFLPPERCAG